MSSIIPPLLVELKKYGSSCSIICTGSHSSATYPILLSLCSFDENVNPSSQDKRLIHKPYLVPIPQQRSRGILHQSWTSSRSCMVCSLAFVMGLAHPLSRPTLHGTRIEATGIRAWLRRRGLHWPCFCTLEAGESVSCQIIHTLSGRVVAYCGQSPSYCGFQSMSWIMFCLDHILIIYSGFGSNSALCVTCL